MTPAQLALEDVPQEEGPTHEAIARHKAELWSLAGSMLAIASDGGLVLPALGGRWESRYTHRFAGPAADDAERLARLLELMRPFRGAEREASWREAVAIAHRGRILVSWELKGGTGLIADSPGDPYQVPASGPSRYGISPSSERPIPSFHRGNVIPWTTIGPVAPARSALFPLLLCGCLGRIARWWTLRPMGYK